MEVYLKIIENIAAGYEPDPEKRKIECNDEGVVTIMVLRNGFWQEVAHFSDLPK